MVEKEAYKNIHTYQFVPMQHVWFLNKTNCGQTTQAEEKGDHTEPPYQTPFRLLRPTKDWRANRFR